ncbi:MAG: NnrS family protein [Gammaproteobacteria bacterium]|nr:NnrS family protein [Gammaproteobacteria bacterium]
MRKTATDYAVFAYGFRPFFLLAGIYATIVIPVWIFSLYGYTLPGLQKPVLIWHAHEMIFGVVVAAVAGFLLTAIPSWTNRRGFAGAPLIVLTLLWLAGRLVFTFAPDSAFLLVAVADLAFVPVLAVIIVPALIRSGSHRNLVFIGLLLLLFMANLYFHSGDAIDALHLTINVMLVTVTLVAGRIIPSFTSAALRQRGIEIKIRRLPMLNESLLLATAAILVVDLFYPNTMLATGLAMATALLMALQLSRWHGHQALKEPIVWILHLAYAWLPIALVMKALWLSGIPMPATSWLHALTTGAFSTMILGVMSRAALGHTGRALVTPPAMVAGYLMLTGAALIRVFAPILHVDAWLLWLTAAALLWTLAFMLFLIVYAPILCSPRADGRAG